MLPALILALAALGIALLRLWAYRAQLLDMARVLEETPPESNLCLTVRMPGAAPRRLCQAVNKRLEEGRQLRQGKPKAGARAEIYHGLYLPRHPHPSGWGHGLFAAAGSGAGA